MTDTMTAFPNNFLRSCIPTSFLFLMRVCSTKNVFQAHPPFSQKDWMC
jgi:hypothetical protein